MGFVNEVRARPPATRQGTFQPHVLRPVPFSRRNICSLQYLIPEACGRALGWPLAPVRSGGLLSGRKNDRRPQGTWTWPLRRAVDGAARALAASGTGSLVPAPAAHLPRPRRTGRRTQASWRPEHLRGSRGRLTSLLRHRPPPGAGTGVEGGSGPPCAVHSTRLCHDSLYTLGSCCTLGIRPDAQGTGPARGTGDHADHVAGPEAPVTVPTARQAWRDPRPRGRAQLTTGHRGRGQGLSGARSRASSRHVPGRVHTARAAKLHEAAAQRPPQDRRTNLVQSTHAAGRSAA